jgi:hypothetical protein
MSVAVRSPVKLSNQTLVSESPVQNVSICNVTLRAATGGLEFYQITHREMWHIAVVNKETETEGPDTSSKTSASRHNTDCIFGAVSE